MRRHRYMVVEHSEAAAEITKDKQFHEYVLPIHTLLGTYHWQRIDAEHVFVTGYYDSSHHHIIETHPKVSMLPSIGSSKKLHVHLKAPHYLALSKKLTLEADSTAADVAEAAEVQFGCIFAPDK